MAFIIPDTNFSDEPKSLHLQGGPMTDAEAREFESRPYFDTAIRVRRYDDMGKVADMKTPDLESFRPLLKKFIRQ
jgi:predicted HD phosphohydrolase